MIKKIPGQSLANRFAKREQTEAQILAGELLEFYKTKVQVRRNSVDEGLLLGYMEGNITVGTEKLDAIIEKIRTTEQEQKFLSTDDADKLRELVLRINIAGMTVNGNPLGGRALGRDIGSSPA